jgi:drug/metabolite transporter (DMT)-like permease
MLSPREKSYLSFFIICFIWGTTWVISALLVKKMPAVQVSGLRHVAGGLMLLIYFNRKKLIIPTKNQWPRLLVMGLLMFTCSNGFSTWAIAYIDPGLGSIIATITAFWIPLFVLWLLKRNVFNAKVIIGLFVGFAGIIVIFFKKVQTPHSHMFWWGIALSLAATVTWSLATVLSMKKKDSATLYADTGWQMLLSGILLVPIAYFTGYWKPIGTMNIETWGLFSYLVIAGSVITFVAYIYAIRHLPGSVLSTYVYINPIIAALFAWLLMNIKPDIYFVLGGLVTLCGVYLVNEGSKKVGDGG